MAVDKKVAKATATKAPAAKVAEAKATITKALSVVEKMKAQIAKSGTGGKRMVWWKSGQTRRLRFLRDLEQGMTERSVLNWGWLEGKRFGRFILIKSSSVEKGDAQSLATNHSAGHRRAIQARKSQSVER